MSYYRLYFMSSFTGHIERFEDFDADDDAQAVSLAEIKQGAFPMELWCGRRRVEQLAALDLASQLLVQRRVLKEVKHQLESELPVDLSQPENRKA